MHGKHFGFSDTEGKIGVHDWVLLYPKLEKVAQSVLAALLSDGETVAVKLLGVPEAAITQALGEPENIWFGMHFTVEIK